MKPILLRLRSIATAPYRLGAGSGILSVYLIGNAVALVIFRGQWNDAALVALALVFFHESKYYQLKYEATKSALLEIFRRQFTHD